MYDLQHGARKKRSLLLIGIIVRMDQILPEATCIFSSVDDARFPNSRQLETVIIRSS